MYSRYICPLRELEYHLVTLLCSRWASRAELLRITFKQTQANGWFCNQYIFGRPEGFHSLLYWLQHKHKQRRCEATCGKRQHVAGHKTMYWLRLTLKPTSTPPTRPTMYWLHGKPPLGPSCNKHLNPAQQTYGNTAQPFRCYSSSLWATNYVLIAKPTICLSLFECDA